MSELLKTALSLSLSGSVLLLMVLLVTRLLRGRLSKCWQYYIWLVVVLRLLVPVSMPFNMTATLLQDRLEQPTNEAAYVLPEEDSQDTVALPPEMDEGVQPAATPPGVQGKNTGLPTSFTRIFSWLWLPWLLVALILLIRKITQYQSFAKYVRAGQTDVTEEALLIEFGRLCADAGVKRTIELRVNPLVASPLLLGILRPCVVLPDIRLPQEELRFILCHELMHYRRGDIFYKWLLQLTVCLHWFNPLVHWMVREVNRVCELSCDEAIIRTLSPGEQRAYGNTLLDSLETPGNYRESLAAVTLHENAVLLKERLESIMSYQKGTIARRVWAVVLCLALFFGGLTLGVYLPDSQVNTVSSDNGGELTSEGLPIMSAANRELYTTYLSPVAVTGLLRLSFTPEDISELIQDGPQSLLAYVQALSRETYEAGGYAQTGTIPADWADEILTTYLPLRQDKVREVCAEVYDENTNTYQYDGGLGGGPAIPIVTGSEQTGSLLTIRYTWYKGDPSEDEFRYKADTSGELVVEMHADSYRYLSNKIIARIVVEETEEEREDWGVAPGDFIRSVTFEESILAPLVWSHITLVTWEDAGEIDPDLLHVYFLYLPFTGELSLDAYEYDKEADASLVPADVYEETIRSHFAVDVEHLRRADAYDAQRNTYALDGVGGATNAKLLDIEEQGDWLLLYFASYQDLELNNTGVVTVQLLENDGYRFVSCTVDGD